PFRPEADSRHALSASAKLETSEIAPRRAQDPSAGGRQPSRRSPRRRRRSRSLSFWFVTRSSPLAAGRERAARLEALLANVRVELRARAIAPRGSRAAAPPRADGLHHAELIGDVIGLPGSPSPEHEVHRAAVPPDELVCCRIGSRVIASDPH